MEDTNNSASPQTPEDPRVAALRGAFKPKLLTYSELSRRAFGSFAFLIEFGIAAMQFGVCLTYLIFVPANLYASCQSLFGGVLVIPKTYFLVGMLLIEIPLTWIQDIRRLTPFNVLATIFIVYGLGSCLLISLSYSYTQKEDTILESMANLPAFQPSWFMFIGTAFFVFEGSITLVVPLQEAVYKKEDRERFPIVNQNVTICILHVLCHDLLGIFWGSSPDSYDGLSSSREFFYYSPTCLFNCSYFDLSATSFSSIGGGTQEHKE